jgi:hypothetical protein
MAKIVILILVLTLIIGSLAGYLYLSVEIFDGNKKIANGQEQLQEGEDMLARGKARLANGQDQLSRANNVYNGIKSIPFFLHIAKRLPVSSEIIQIANNKIAEGSDLIAKGKEKIKAGEQQLAQGKLELKHGMRRLKEANWIRVGCEIGMIVFTFLFLGLLYRFRRCWR